MANKKNLIPQAHTLTVEEQSKGGIASGQARKQKKLLKEILADILDDSASNSPFFCDIAKEMNLTSKSVKEVFSLICLINSAREGDLCDLERLAKLLGEDALNVGGSDIEDDPITKALMEEAERMNNGDI